MRTIVAEPSAFVAWRDRIRSDLLAAYPELIARMSWDRERILAHQRQRLHALLARRAGYLRARVQGRSDETFHYRAVTVPPRVTRSVLVQALDMRDYQVHQTATGIDLAAVANPALDTRPLRNALRTALTRAGLHHPRRAAARGPRPEPQSPHRQASMVRSAGHMTHPVN